MGYHQSSHIGLDSGKRVLFLTKDLSLIQKQLYENLNLKMIDLKPQDLLDDINTDIMTPAWVCFQHKPQDIARHAYAGLYYNGERVFRENALIEGNFQAIVSGQRKGTGSSRETAAQCERYSGITLVFAASFAPIHERNNINLGQLMGGYDLLIRLQKGESIALEEFLMPFDSMAQKILKSGGLFAFLRKPMALQKKPKNGAVGPMTMIEKLMARKALTDQKALPHVKPKDCFVAQVDGGYSHEFTSAQVHEFLIEEFGPAYTIKNPERFAAFEDHLIYADDIGKYKAFLPQIQTLRTLQKTFIKHTQIQDYSATQGISPGICHEVAREELIWPGDFIEATDSHTCMGGCLNALCYGVGATEYAALLGTGLAIVNVPESIRFELSGRLPADCTAKDLMLHILNQFVRNGATVNRAIEFGGPGLLHLSMDERATLCNMATECGAKTGLCEADEVLYNWLEKERKNADRKKLMSTSVFADPNAHYAGGIHHIDLSQMRPMVAHPGDPNAGIPSDPTNGAYVSDLPQIAIDIAYGGSCTAGKYDDIEFYARVVKEALKKGQKVHPKVRFYIQYGSKKVEAYAQEKGFDRLFKEAQVITIHPGCGACIGCGPGISEHSEQVTVSAINRNFQGRSGPGKLFLASPLTVAASAFAGFITSFLAA